jgi:hypothetical protein
LAGAPDTRRTDEAISATVACARSDRQVRLEGASWLLSGGDAETLARTLSSCIGRATLSGHGLTSFEAAAQAATPACLLLPRNQALGGALTTSVSYDNQARIETAGADIAVYWNFPFASGNGINLNVEATWLSTTTERSTRRHRSTSRRSGRDLSGQACGGPIGPPLFLCAEHVRQLGGESPLLNLMEVKG